MTRGFWFPAVLRQVEKKKKKTKKKTKKKKKQKKTEAWIKSPENVTLLLV